MVGHTKLFSKMRLNKFHFLVLKERAVLIIFFCAVITHQVRAQVSMDTIIMFSHNGKYALAEELFDEFDSLQRTDIYFLTARAYNYSWWKKYDQSSKLFKSVLLQSPDNEEALTGLAYNYRYAGDIAKSNHFFNKVLSINQDDLNALKGLTYNYLDVNKIYGAQYHLKRAISFAPYDSELHYLVGLIEVKKKNFNKARQAFKRSLDIDENYQPARNQIARMVNQSSKLEINSWYGRTDNGDLSKIGFRRMDINYSLSNDLSLFGFWDSSMSFENNLFQNSPTLKILGLNKIFS